MDIIWTNHWGRFVVGLIFAAAFLEQPAQSPVTQTLITGGCREQRKSQNICIWRACVGAEKSNRQPGKIQGRFFCGFPACPAEFAVPGDRGAGQCLAAQGTGSHPCSALPASPTSAPCSICIFGGSWRLKCPHQQGNNLPKAMEEGVCFGQLKLFLDFTFCLALQEWLQPLSAAPGLKEGDLKLNNCSKNCAQQEKQPTGCQKFSFNLCCSDRGGGCYKILSLEQKMKKPPKKSLFLLKPGSGCILLFLTGGQLRGQWWLCSAGLRGTQC